MRDKLREREIEDEINNLNGQMLTILNKMEDEFYNTDNDPAIIEIRSKLKMLKTELKSIQGQIGIAPKVGGSRSRSRSRNRSKSQKQRKQRKQGHKTRRSRS